MKRYGGTLVHADSDEYGLIEVVDVGEERQLFFDTPIQQSSVLLHAPEVLVFEYYRAMCVALLALPEVRNILILGLGGGALARFLLHSLPAVGVTAVEVRETVVDIAYSHFDLPANPRLQCWVAEAGYYIDHCDEHYDVVMVDLFDAVGLSDAVGELGFIARCKHLLHDPGVLVMNLWRSEKGVLRDTVETLRESFGANVEFVDVDDANTVAVARSASGGPVTRKQLKARAHSVFAATGLDLMPYLQRLHSHP